MKYYLTLTALLFTVAVGAESLTNPGQTENTGYAPNDGSARPGNPGTFTTQGTGSVQSTDIDIQTDTYKNDGKSKVEAQEEGVMQEPTETELKNKQHGE